MKVLSRIDDFKSRLRENGHLFLLRQLLWFLGGSGQVPQAMFPYPWPSRLGRIGQIIYALVFLGKGSIRSRNMILAYGLGPDMLQGDVVVTDSGIRREMLACARAGRPFLLARSSLQRPIARACRMLGIDATAALLAYMSLNALIVLYAHSEGRPVVVHLATSVSGKIAIDRHRQGLETVHALGLPRAAGALIPDLISMSTSSGYDVLMQSRLPGTAQLYRHRPEAELHAAIGRALDALLLLRIPAVCDEGADEVLIHTMFPRLLECWPRFRPIMEPLLERLQAWQRQKRLGGILTHGDFWLRNVLFDESSGQVSGIVDWERCRSNGTPGLDALHLALMTLAMEHGRDVVSYIEQVWTRQWETDFLAQHVARLEAAYGLDPVDTGHLAAILYCDEFHKLQSAGRAMSPQRRQRFHALRPAIEAWLERSMAA